MGKDIDTEVREHIRLWVRHFRDRERESGRCPTDRAFAELLGVSPSHLSDVMSGSRTAGLEILVALRLQMHADLSEVIDRPPGQRAPATPSSASAAPARPARRRTGGAAH